MRMHQINFKKYTFLHLISGKSTFKVGNHLFVKINANLESLQPKNWFNGKKTAFLRKFDSERVNWKFYIQYWRQQIKKLLIKKSMF